jgi:N-acetylneuraminic acid mutarotase
MIVFGGLNSTAFLGDGARYSSATNTWTLLPTTGAPSARAYHTAVWTGSDMIVWGGYGYNSTLVTNSNLSDGGYYNPASDSWLATVTVAAPYARNTHTAVWTGTEMLVWGGYNAVSLGVGGRYAPLTGVWTSTATTGSPPNRSYHTAVWTGSEMLVFGGANGGYLNDTCGYSIGKTMFLYQKP